MVRLLARVIEAYVIHASSVAVSREHRRAKTDRLDTELLKRSFLGWLRGERAWSQRASQKPSRPASKATAMRGLKPRMPSRTNAAFIRLTIRLRSPMRLS